MKRGNLGRFFTVIAIATVLAGCTSGTDSESAAEPTTVQPRTAATTVASTVGPTTAALTTVGPTTVGPTTVQPRTAATTVASTVGPTTVATTAAPTSVEAASACTNGSTGVPDGAAHSQVVDVDGDGLTDTVWIMTDPDGETRVGIVTAAGGGAERVFQSASPVPRSVLVVDADQRSPVEIFADDGRSVQLWAFVDCAIADIENIQGETYTFSLGFADVGSGVGCVDIDGRRQLVGLDVTNDTAEVVDWSRTIVELEGTRARNGGTSTGVFNRPDDDVGIALLHDVTCGELTMRNDGLQELES